MRLKSLFLALGLLAAPFSPAGAHDHAHMTHTQAAQPVSGASIYNLASRWTDQDGKTVDLKSLGGKPLVAAMAYTSCKDICPLIVANMVAIEKAAQSQEPARRSLCLLLAGFSGRHPGAAQGLCRGARSRSAGLDAVQRRRKGGARSGGGPRRALSPRRSRRLRSCERDFAAQRQGRDRLPEARRLARYGRIRQQDRGARPAEEVGGVTTIPSP